MYVNKQNLRIWDEEQTKDIQQLPYHPEKEKVWGGLWASEIIGAYFFKNDAGEFVTVNGDCYRATFTDYLTPEIESRDLGQHLLSTRRHHFPHIELINGLIERTLQ